MKELSLFSPCASEFLHGGPDGKLKLWNTLNGSVKLEYVPNLHLNSPYTSSTWVSASLSTTPAAKKKKRKVEDPPGKCVAFGTTSGSVAVYSIEAGKVITSLTGAHSSPVSCLTWHSSAGLFSSADGVVFQWDLSQSSVKTKWKCNKQPLTGIGVSPDGSLLATARMSIKLWNIDSHKLVNTYIGHSSEIINLSFIDNQYFISCSDNDRHLSAWNTTNESGEPVARFALSDVPKGAPSVVDVNGIVHILSVTKSGVLHLFQQQLNGKCNKPVKPSQTIEIALDSIEGSNNSGSTVPSVPIVAACFSSPTTAVFAYGTSFFTFETIDIRNSKEDRLILVRKPRAKAVISKPVEGVAQDDVTYVNGDLSGGVKRKATGAADIPMTDRLSNLSIDNNAGASGTTDSSKPSSLSMAHLLIQGLESKDKSILQSVLLRKETTVIRETVSRLPVQVLSPLVKELINMLHGKTFMSAMATTWLKELVTVFSSQILSDPSVCEQLSGLTSFLEARLNCLEPLLSLEGRLGLLVSQVSESTSQAPDQDLALLLFQDPDSSDEGSLAGDGEASESELDKWQEMSDDEDPMDTEDNNQSS